MSQPIMLGGVVIVAATNGVIRVKIAAGAVESATIASGTYYLRGDGSADDLCKAIKTALDATTGANTYSVIPFFNLVGNTIHTVVQISRTAGADAFELRFGDASTTFDPALIGMLEQTYTGSTDYNSDEACAATWCSNDHSREIEPISTKVASVQRAISGSVRGVSRSARMQSWRIGLAFVVEGRMNMLAADALAYGEQNALEAFVDRFGAGGVFELHEAEDPDGTITAGDLNTTTTRVGVMHFSEETLRDFAPQRLGPGVALYSIDLVAHKQVTS